MASRLTELYRLSYLDEAGNEVKLYPVKIQPVKTTYILDDLGNKTSILQVENLPSIELNQEQVLTLYTKNITVNGTDTTLGELIANKIDNIIQAHLNQ